MLNFTSVNFPRRPTTVLMNQMQGWAVFGEDVRFNEYASRSNIWRRGHGRQDLRGELEKMLWIVLGQNGCGLQPAAHPMDFVTHDHG